MSQNRQQQPIDLDNPEFQTVLSLLESTNRSVFLTGKAGTGKSTFLRYITANTNKKYVVLAPTGIAAVNVGGQTIHSFFHLPFKPLLPDDPDYATPQKLKRFLKYNNWRLKLYKELELIIIDEISMVRADMIDFIDKILRFSTGNRRQPFGGKQLLLVGDIFQLEPVVTPDMKEILNRWYPTPYFFDALVFKEFNLVSIELKKVYRQTDRTFIEMLDRIRIGSPTQADIVALNGRLSHSDECDEDDGHFSMTIATRRDMVDLINETRLDALTTPLRTYIGSSTGEFPESSFPTELELTLKEGAQVVFVKNDVNRRWVNGSLGRVVEATDDEITVELENGNVHTIEKEVWTNIRFCYDKETHKINEEVIGTFTQYPLKLAWALTIHKSQGLTFKSINVDVGRGAFTGGQSYVALSRCTSLEGIRLKSTLNERDIFVNPTVQQFSQTYNNPDCIEAAMNDAKADSLYVSAAKSFESKDYGATVRALCWASDLRNDLPKPPVTRLIASKLTSLIKSYESTIHDLRNEIAERDMRLRQLADEYVEMGDNCREEAWDLNAAVNNYDRALVICPSHIDAMLGKAQAQLAMSDAEGAISTYTKATEVDTGDYRAPYELGRFFLTCDDYSNALDRLLVALSRNDSVPGVHDSLAELYDAIDDEEQAELHRKKAEKLRHKSNRRKK